jgi:drug/metabolite transporter (DMT)-like permease
MPLDNRITGTLLVAGSAMLFACKGLLAKALYAQGIGFELVVSVRSLLAMPFFWVFVAARQGMGSLRETPPRLIVAACIAGILCYYVGALTDFYALTMIDASVERVLLFSYPAIVVVISAILKREWPGAGIVLATLVTYLGIFLVVGGFDTGALRANYVGALFVLIAAMTTASYFMMGERFAARMGSGRFTMFAMTAATAVLTVHLIARHSMSELASITLTGWLLLIAIATACMFIPALMQTEGVSRLGAERAAVISTAGPPTTILLGWLFFGESLNRWQVLGVALILAGIVVVDLVRVRRRAR